MRKLTLKIVFFLLFISPNLIFSEEIIVNSKITNVKIYPEWAYITRKAKIKISNGITKAVFSNLPPWIDVDSIIIKVEPFDGCNIIGATTKTLYLRKISEKEVSNAKEEVIKLRDKLEDLNTELKALEEEKKYLQGLVSWKKDNNLQDRVSRKIDIKELNETNSFIKNSILTNLKNRDEINRKIRDLQPDLIISEKKWAELKNRANLEKKEIIIELESKNNRTIDIYLSYLISGASWYPKYNARADKDGKNIDITYNAIIQQSTGEDWNDTEIILSTIKPYLIRQKPELNPWYINELNANTDKTYSFNRSLNQEYNEKLKAIQKTQIKQMDLDDSMREAYDNYQLNIEQARDVLKQTEERGTTVEFEIKGNYSIKTDGMPVKVQIGEAKINAEPSFSAIPAVSKSTYVTSKMKNNTKFPFLPGVVSVYKSGSFIGKSKIDFIAEKEKFELYMGLEERIKVSRILDLKKSSSSLFKSKKILIVGYNIEVQNFLNTPIKVNVSDQIPVSESNQVKVKLNEINPKVEKKEKGIIEWDVLLNPSEKKILYFEFEIESPKNIILKNANEIEEQILRSK